MKKFLSLMLLLALFSNYSFSQGTETTTPPAAKSPVLVNDFYVGYGGLSLFYFTNTFNHYYQSGDVQPQSFGGLFLGYERELNRVVGAGFMVGYQNFYSSGNGASYGGVPYEYTNSNSDDLIMLMARFTFKYVNKRKLQLYSGTGMGVTIDLEHTTYNGITSSKRSLLPAGQLTFMGVHIGRILSGFVEFGIGTYGILNAGLSYKFSD
jgi:hypothetical protein